LVALFLGAVVVCALVPLNAWPFSSWELFSHLRTDRKAAWSAVAVDRSGRERGDPIGSFANGYEGFSSIMSGFAGRPAASRQAICAAWLRLTRERFGPDTRALLVYHVQWRLPEGHTGRTLSWTCDAKGAHATS
jgi:hypothetical protein